MALANAVAEVADAPSPASAPASAPTTLKSAAVFERMHKGLVENKAVVDRVKAVYLFNIQSGAQTVQVTVDAKSNDSAGVKPGPHGTPDCTITMADTDFVDLANGKLDAMAAFGQGKIKIGGNPTLAMKLSLLTQPAAKL